MEDRSIEVVKLEVLHLLHKEDHWGEELLANNLFAKEHKRFKPKWFFILEEKVNGTSNEEIARILGWTRKSVVEAIAHLKGVLRDGFRKDIDSRLPFGFKRVRHSSSK